jgi:hypothetical protein
MLKNYLSKNLQRPLFTVQNYGAMGNCVPEAARRATSFDVPVCAGELPCAISLPGMYGLMRAGNHKVELRYPTIL